MTSMEEQDKEIAACFGDSQQYDGGWFAEYDGKWVDITNDVENVKALLSHHTQRARVEGRTEAALHINEFLRGDVDSVELKKRIVLPYIDDQREHLAQLSTKEEEK